MRVLCKATLALGLAALLCRPAAAQPAGAGAVFLLVNRSVQEELKLDNAQLQKVRPAFGKFLQEHGQDIVKFQAPNLTPEERMRLVRKLGEEGRKAVADILTPEQLKRLK
jgi:hypothetical protein